MLTNSVVFLGTEIQVGVCTKASPTILNIWFSIRNSWGSHSKPVSVGKRELQIQTLRLKKETPIFPGDTHLAVWATILIQDRGRGADVPFLRISHCLLMYSASSASVQHTCCCGCRYLSFLFVEFLGVQQSNINSAPGARGLTSSPQMVFENIILNLLIPLFASCLQMG